MESQYDEKMRKIKNNRLVVWGLIIFGIIVGASQLLDSGNNIIKKLLDEDEQPKSDSTKTPIIVQPSNPSVIILPTEFKPVEQNGKPAKIKLVQFAVNSDSCYFEARINNNIMSIEPILSMDMEGEEIPEDYTFEKLNRQTKKIEKVHFEESRYHPFLDFTFFNEGDEKTILTTIKVTIDKVEPDQGGGGSSTGSHAIEALNKYKIVIPNLIQTFYQNPKYKFVKEYPALPPMLVDSNDAARIQMVLANNGDVMARYWTTIEVIFSNGQSFSKKMIVYF